jgi:hypothetical protein
MSSKEPNPDEVAEVLDLPRAMPNIAGIGQDVPYLRPWQWAKRNRRLPIKKVGQRSPDGRWPLEQ